MSPSSRVTIGESFGLPIGTIVTKKIIAAAKEIGFQYVFDVNFGADITVIEEANELLSRLEKDQDLPMFTSCCPAWINFVEKLHPELTPNISTTKSPHMCSASVIKSYFATKEGLDPKQIFLVSLMPCVAKKDEVKRNQLLGEVDAVLTNVEFASLLKEFQVDFANLEEKDFDPICGESTGAAALFGVSGGVMEASIRYAHEIITKQPLDKVEYTQFRDFKDIKTGTVEIGDKTIKVAVCNGIAHAREIIETGDYKQFQFIEVMACPGGCIGGGGQPKLKDRKLVRERAKSIFKIDESIKERTSAQNLSVQKIYEEFFGSPNSELALSLLHTSYSERLTPLLELKRKVGTQPIVAYGSASGNASRYARIFASYIGTVPVPLNVVTMSSIAKRQYFIIFCSTFGDGEFPNNALKFVQQLKDTTEDLSELQYCIAALGSKDYEKFCYCGHQLDRILNQKKAKRFMPLVEINSSSDDRGEGMFEAWAPHAVMALGQKMPDIVVTPNFSVAITQRDDDVVHKAPEKPIGFDYGILQSSTVLTPPGTLPMHRYQIKLPPGVSYETGDHAAILAENDPEIVNKVLGAIGLEPSSVLTVRTSLPEGYSLIPSRLTAQQLFQRFLDLNGVPSRNLIRAFKAASTSEHAIERFERILNPADPRAYNEMVRDTSTGEFILEHAREGLPKLDILISAIPHIRPRLYCIASAPSVQRTTIDLIISDNQFGPELRRHGLCTAYLKRFGLTRVALRTQRGIFSYPKDPTTPIVMAAFGCGIAPMMGLLQHRETLGGEIGDAVLFFGCRNKGSYPLLETQLSEYLKQGTLQDLFISYTREGKTPVYLTDLIEKEADRVWEYWRNPRTTFVYCGPPRGVPEIIRNKFVKISMEKGNMSQDVAVRFCNHHPHFIESF